MNNFYNCRECNGTMNGRFCEDCGFDELLFCVEWEEYNDSLETNQDEEAA